MSEPTQLNQKCDAELQGKLEQAHKQLAQAKAEGVETSKKLQKERQKVQNLLNELKISQENLQKVKLTFVPQENVHELESSIRQLQATIKNQEAQESEHKKMI